MNPEQRPTSPAELNALERAALAAARWSWTLLSALSLSCNMNPVPEDPGLTQGDQADIPGFTNGEAESTPTSGVGTIDESDGVVDPNPEATIPLEPSAPAGTSAPGTGMMSPTSSPTTTITPPATSGTTPPIVNPDTDPLDPTGGGEPAPSDSASDDGGVDGGAPTDGGTLFALDADVGDAAPDAGDGGTP